MKQIKVLFAAFAMALSGATLAQEASVVNPYGRFLEGDGVNVEMAQFSEKNSAGLYDVLLRINGENAFNAGIDGKTLKYQAVHGGSGIDYQRDGKNIMSVRRPYGNSYASMEVFLDGKSIALSENRARSKDVLPLHLLTASGASGR